MKNIKNFKKIFIIVISAIIIMVLNGCNNNKNDEKDLPSVINIGTQQMPNGEAIVKAQKYFDELGVTVNLVEFDSGKDVNTALASGSIDLGMLGSSPATVCISSGIEVELIWIHDIIGKAESLAVKANSEINSLSDLVGKKIAMPFGSTAHYSLLNALKLENISETSVTLLDLQPADIYAAWQRGDIDGAYIWNPVLGNLLADGGIIITSSEELAKKGVVTADVEVVRTKFAQQYPKLVAEYIKLQAKAVDIYKNNFSEAVNIIAKAYDISNEESERQIKEFIWLSPEEHLSSEYLGTSDKKGAIVQTLKSTSEFLAEQKLIEKSPDISVFEKAVNPKYIETAIAK